MLRAIYHRLLEGAPVGAFHFDVGNDRSFSMIVVCPGCGEQKRLPLYDKTGWKWNDSWQRPTLTPLVRHGNCLWSLTDGEWRDESDRAQSGDPI
jgi:hypothetical protein